MLRFGSGSILWSRQAILSVPSAGAILLIKDIPVGTQRIRLCVNLAQFVALRRKHRSAYMCSYEKKPLEIISCELLINEVFSGDVVL